MAKIDVKTADMRQAGQDEDALAGELRGIEGEIQNIISSLRISSSASSRIRQKLRNSMEKVSDSRQKIQILSGTLEEVARLYEDTERRITGSHQDRNLDNSANQNIQNAMAEAAKRLARVAGSAGMDNSSAYSKDPVNLCNGNYVYEKSFLKLDTVIPMEFRIFYNSQCGDAGVLGRGWVHSYERKLIFDQERTGMVQEDGSLLIFLRENESNFHPLPGTFGRLNRTDAGYEVTDRENYTYLFDDKGKWLQKKDAFGNEISLIYREDELVRVEDNYGNFYQFRYVGGRLEEVSDHAGRKINILYEGNSIISIKDSMGRITGYRYNRNEWLEEITNGNGVICLKNIYDPAGRVIRQEFPDGGVVLYEYLDQLNQVRMTEQNGNVVFYERDELYRNIRNIYENGEERFTHDENNQRTSFTDRNGHTSFYEYGADGNLKSFTNALQDKLEYTYTDIGQVESVALNGTVLYKAVYNEKNLQESVENVYGTKNRYEYDEAGHPISWIQPDGCRIEITYDEKGNMNSITNTMGGRTNYEYDEQNRVISVTDPSGNITEFKYDDSDEIIQVKNANGDIRQYEYDDCGNLTKLVDYAGGVTEIVYNAINKPVRITDPEGHSSCMEYDIMWNLAGKTAADGGTTRYEYDRLNRLIKVTDPEGAVNHLVYDDYGNLIQRVAADGGIYRIKYDALNRPEQVSDPCGHTVSAEYDRMGNVTRVVYEDGNDEEYRYDLNGNMIFSRDRGGYCKEYTYDSSGNLTGVKDEDTWLEQYEYYPGGLIRSEKKLDGTGKYYEYDARENLIKITNQDGCSWHFEYDCMERVIHCEQDGGISESYEYDALDNIVAVTDGEGNRTGYAYSPCGETVSVTDALGHITYFRYDACQRLIGIIQAQDGSIDIAEIDRFNRRNKNLRIISYERDRVGNIVKTINPEGEENLYTYDSCGRILSQLDGDGNLISCEYNPDGTEKEYCFADGRTVRYEYNALKQLVQMEDWFGITSITNDAMGRICQVVSPDGEKITYEWGKRGEARSITYPDGCRAEYLYDDALRLAALKTETDTVSYAYSSNGRLQEKNYQNGFRTFYHYDPSGKIQEICHKQGDKVIDRLIYGYDRTDRKNSIVRFRTGMEENGNYRYQYNAVGSLISVCRDGVEEEKYCYDNFGNRTYAKIYGKEQRYSYDRLDRLISLYDENGEHKYSYDGRGNLTGESLNGKQILGLEFDERNLLAKAENGQGCIKYSYNGFGHRVGRDICFHDGGRERTDYLYHVTEKQDDLIQLKKGGVTENILWDGGLLGLISGQGSRFWLNDEQMSPMRVIGREGILSSVHRETFGSVRSVSGSGEEVFGYAGYRPDGLAGLYHAGQREYSPSTGRFISRDAFPGLVMVPLTLNAYIYCLSDPVNHVDPTGLVVAWLAGGIVGAVANVAGKVAGDVVNSIKNGKLQVSSWQSYVGSAAGGFASGTVFATTGNSTAAGAVGNAVEKFTSNGLSMLTGAEGYRREDGYSFGRLMWDTTRSAAGGAASGFAFGSVGDKIKIPGVNKGSGSHMAVFKQVMTKASRGQIKNVAWKTVGKGIIAYGPVNALNQVVTKGEDEIRKMFRKPFENPAEKITQMTMAQGGMNAVNARNCFNLGLTSAVCAMGGT